MIVDKVEVNTSGSEDVKITKTLAYSDSGITDSVEINPAVKQETNEAK